jgi:hypothetical protein
VEVVLPTLNQVKVETVAVVQVNLILLFPLLHQQQEQLTQVVVVVEYIPLVVVLKLHLVVVQVLLL